MMIINMFSATLSNGHILYCFTTLFSGTATRSSEKSAKKSKKGFSFPHWAKYIAWFLCLSIIAASSIILTMYGMTFGLIKSYLWLTAVGSSFITSILITQPIKIMAMTCFKKLISKKQQQLLWKRIPQKSLKNPYQEGKYLEVMAYRERYVDAYQPTPISMLKDRFEDIKYTIELRTIAIDLALYILYMIALYYVVLIDKSSMSYYSSEVIEYLVVKAKYSNTLPLSKIVSYEELIEYLNYTLLPTLLVNSTEWHHKSLYISQNLNKFRGRTWQRQLKKYNRMSLTKDQKLALIDSAWRYFDSATENVDENEKNKSESKDSNKERKPTTNVYDRGWTLEKSVKLIGKIRLRQIRVRNDSCDFVKKVPTRENECPAELSLWNEERRSFSIMWTLNDSYKFTKKQMTPWTYQTGWQSRSVGIFAKFSNYPGGGYIVEFAKSLNNSRIILEFLHELQWIDFKTRAIFIEFTTYSVDTNLFNVVTLILERSAVGYFIPSYQIHTTKFIFLESETEKLTIFMFGLFTAFLLIFLLRETLRMQKTSLKIYFFQGWAILDFSIITIGFISVIFTILRNNYVSHLFKTLEKSDNNKFVSFIYAGMWDSITNYTDAVLVCLSTVKLFRILTFRATFYQMETVLKISRSHVLNLSLQMLVLIVGFAVLFHLTLVHYDYNFSTFLRSLSSMVNRAISMDDTFDSEVFVKTPWYLGPAFFAVFISFSTVILLNLFISIVLHNLRQVKLIPLSEKYSLLKYIKHRITSKHQKDVLQLKKGSDDVLRLKGGGNSCCKRKKGKQKSEEHSDNEDGDDDDDGDKNLNRAVIREKILNSFVQFGQADLLRFEGMKHLTKKTLINDEIQESEKEKGMMMVVLQQTYEKSYPPYDEKFFVGYIREEKKLICSHTLMTMRDFAENILQEKKLEVKSKQSIKLTPKQ